MRLRLWTSGELTLLAPAPFLQCEQDIEEIDRRNPSLETSSRGRKRAREEDEGDEDERHEEAAAKRPAVKSVVVTREDDEDEEGASTEKSSRRTADGATAGANERRRNMRMMGALMGTLKRFKQEEEEESKKEKEARRRELWQRAEKKSRDEAERKRHLALEPVRKRREAAQAKWSKLEAEQRIAEIDLLSQRWVDNVKARQHFCITASTPPVYWLPARRGEGGEGENGAIADELERSQREHDDRVVEIERNADECRRHEEERMNKLAEEHERLLREEREAKERLQTFRRDNPDVDNGAGGVGEDEHEQQEGETKKDGGSEDRDAEKTDERSHEEG